MSAESPQNLLHVPLNALHIELGARMVPFAGYSMPVQYPSGLMAEHQHTREAAGFFDVSHMGQLMLLGADACAAFESLMPVDVIDLPVGKQRYGLLLNDAGGIMDDLMFLKLASDTLFVVVNGACKAKDIAHIQAKIGRRCTVKPLPERALLALQGPKAVEVLQALVPGVEKMVFMDGGYFEWQGVQLIITRSGYTGEDGFEVSIDAVHAEQFARALLSDARVQPIGLGARNSLRLEAGLCLYGNDLDETTTPIEAALHWAIQKVRRPGGAREGGFPGAMNIIATNVQNSPTCWPKNSKIPVFVPPKRLRVGLKALERIPVREHTELQDASGNKVGEVTSGLLGPTINQPIAMAYVATEFAEPGTQLNAMVRGKPVPMEVVTMPFVPQRYYRG